MLTFFRKPFILILLSFVMTPSQAEKINFVIAADPQIGYYSTSIKNAHTKPTMYEAGAFLYRCSTCIKTFWIAGDLVHDNSGGESEYGSIHIDIETTKVKIFDGLGNHDTNNFRDDWVSFDSRSGLYHVGHLDKDKRSDPIDSAERQLLNQLTANTRGWSIYHTMYSHIETNEVDTSCDATDVNQGRHCGNPCGSFRFSDAYYCENKSAWYYAVGMYGKGSRTQANVTNLINLTNVARLPKLKPDALVVQLHNYVYSATAVKFLASLEKKLAKEGLQDIPIILVGHQDRGAAKSKFDDIVKKLNVAALLQGHWKCPEGAKTDRGHCTNEDSNTAYVNNGSSKNIYGFTIPIINTNAILHDIFWAVSLDTKANTLALKRIYRGVSGLSQWSVGFKGRSFRETMFIAREIWPITTNEFSEDPKNTLTWRELVNDYYDKNPETHNWPTDRRKFYVCNFTQRGNCNVTTL